MHFGMPTLIETNTLADCAALCKELGLDFIELNMNLPQFQMDHIQIELYQDIARRYGIYYTLHLDENMNPCDFNSLVREAYLQTAIKTIERAKCLQAPVINMHLHHGVNFKMPSEKVFLYNVYMDMYLDHMAIFRDACEKAAGDSGIMICIENTNGYHHLFAKKALELLLESKTFGLTYDIGHDHCIGGMDEGIIMACCDRLCHMHMHDAQGDRCHLALGDGIVDLPKYFALAKEMELRVVLETKTVVGLKRSAVFAKSFEAAVIR